MTPPDCLLERERLVQAHADWSREIAALDHRIAAALQALAAREQDERVSAGAVLVEAEERRSLARDVARARRERDDLIALVTAWSARSWPSPPIAFRAATPTERRSS